MIPSPRKTQVEDSSDTEGGRSATGVTETKALSRTRLARQAPDLEVPAKAQRRKFRGAVLASILGDKILRIRAGTGSHRFIGIWAVVVEGRVFVRSWSLKPRSWYRTFLVEPRGAILIDDRELAVRALRTRSERLLDAVDRAYLEKYNTRGSIKYAQDLGRAKSRATTTELVPL